MLKGPKRLVLPVLFTLGCSLAGQPAGAAIRVEPRPTNTGWLSRLFVHLPFGLGRNGSQLDPDGQSTSKNGSQVDPNGQTKPNKNGSQLDPNGGSPTKP